MIWALITSGDKHKLNKQMCENVQDDIMLLRITRYVHTYNQLGAIFVTMVLSNVNAMNRR